MLCAMKRILVGSLATLGVLSVGGCPANDGTGGPIGGGGTGSLRVVVTDHEVNVTGGLKIGDGFIAFGVDTGSGINFIRKSSATAAVNLSNSLSLLKIGFNVAGTWIAAREFDGSVHLYDTATDTLINVPTTELSLSSGNAIVDEFWADGDFMVTFANANTVTDGFPIKLIDFSQNPPVITSFTQTPPENTGSRSGERSQAAVDADARRFVVQVVDTLYLYSFDDPTGAPEVFDFSASGGISSQIQIFLDGDFVLYHDHDGVSDGRHVTRLANLATRSTDVLAENPSSDEDVYLEGNQFGYFAQETEDDLITNTLYRSVFGQITANGVEFTLLPDPNDAVKDNDRTLGVFGYGQTLAITPNGRFRFVAGDGTAANIAEYLQVSVDGGDFKTLDDPEDSGDEQVFGSNVVATDEVCAFTTLDHRLAFILLN